MIDGALRRKVSSSEMVCIRSFIMDVCEIAEMKLTRWSIRFSHFCAAIHL